MSAEETDADRPGEDETAGGGASKWRDDEDTTVTEKVGMSERKEKERPKKREKVERNVLLPLDKAKPVAL